MNDAAALAGARSSRLFPPALSRIWLAVAAAVLMHAAALTSTRPGARTSEFNASVPVRAITVRAIPSVPPPLAPALIQATAQEGGATAPVPTEAAPQSARANAAPTARVVMRTPVPRQQ